MEKAEKITEHDIISFLGGIPKPKIHCACLARRTLRRAIERYRKTKTRTDAKSS